MKNNPFPQPICEQIWNTKYRLVTPNPDILDDLSVMDTWNRIADACASTELKTYGVTITDETRQTLINERTKSFRDILRDFAFIPAGRIIAGAGSGRNVTLFNCYVMGTIPDSINGIFDMLKEAAITMQQGGGIGYDFSSLRPKNSPVKGVDADASGPLTFMDVWDSMCRTIMSAGNRRGAMMATMRCDHPDIMDFITAKRDPTRLRMFNISVLATDDFMDAVAEDRKFELVHEVAPADTSLGQNADGKWIYQVVRAKELWQLMMESTYNYAEPGILFIDRINKKNNLWYVETILATNPCFTGNQKIMTANGPMTLLELEGQRVDVLTENQTGKLIYRPMDVFKTAVDQEILRITLDDGTIIDCTHTHEFFDLNRNRVEARDLISGQRLASVYRHNANSKGYKRLTNGIDNPLEHHIPFENNGRYRNDINDNDLQEMRKTGMSYKAIADIVGCSKYTIMKRLGYDRPNHKVVSVEPLMERQDVFCGTVNETHKFFLACENGGVLVSNCGEQPLPPYGACLLGSINLTQVVVDAFERTAHIDQNKLEYLTRQAVRMLDSIIDISNFPIPQQKEEAQTKRRMGLGITGLADMLFMLNTYYGSAEAAEIAGRVMQIITLTAYHESIGLARLLGPCPVTASRKQREQFIQSGFMVDMPEDIRQGVLKHGIRNALLTSIAPTGTISLYAGNISSGVEPIFAPSYTRKVLQKDGTKKEELIEDYAVKLYHEWRENKGYDEEPNPEFLVTAQTLKPQDHLVMQAAVQRWVDSSISKTINCPKDIAFEDFEAVYLSAYQMGCKGCTTYRPNDVTGSVLSVEKDEPEQGKNSQTPPPESVVTASGLIPRNRVLDGQTYKLKWDGTNFYVTINNHLDHDGRIIPFEIFINTQDMSHFQWTVALTRMMSSVFRRGGDINFVIKDLKSIMDPNGGAWIDGKYLPSFIALLGRTLEQHLDFLSSKTAGECVENYTEEITQQFEQENKKPIQCPNCKGFNVRISSGCPVCGDCGHSKCG